MSTDENKAIIRQFSNVWNTGKLDDLDNILAPNFVVHGSEGNITGIEEWKQFVTNYSAGKDVHVRVDELIADGDWVAERWTMRATDTATGEQTTFQGMTIHRFANGKLQEDWAVAETRPTGG